MVSKQLLVYFRRQWIDCILSGLPGVCCFHDNILSFGNSDKEHDDHTTKVLNRLDKAGVRLRSDKCEFNKSEVQYLGHIVDQCSLRPTQEKIRAIKEAPTPTNVTELKSFLGLLNYYNRFLPNLCETLKPLHSLLQKGKQWKWTHKEEAFESGKSKLLNSNFLAHYDLSLPVKLSCDASPYGIGACLTHVYED